MDPALLGLPLASPLRRGLAMLVDLTVVALLAAIGGVVLGFLVSLLFFRMAVGRRPGEAPPSASIPRTAFRASVGCLGAFILFVTILSVWGGLALNTRGGGPSRNEIAAMVDSIMAEVEAGRTPTAIDLPRQSGIRDTLRRFAEDLGVGIGWAALYFTVGLTLWNGRTPGKRLLGLRVVRLDGTRMGWWSAFERYGGYAAGFATGLLGFAQVYWDPNRQATHDKIAGTVVIREGTVGANENNESERA